MRPARPGPRGNDTDLEAIWRALRRAKADGSRSPAKRDALIAHLQAAKAILLSEDEVPKAEPKKRGAA